MEKIQILFMLCFGLLSVYNFLRVSELHNPVDELQTGQRGMEIFSKNQLIKFNYNLI